MKSFAALTGMPLNFAKRRRLPRRYGFNGVRAGIIAVLISVSFSTFAELECSPELNIDAMGVAWYDNGGLYTGILDCSSTKSDYKEKYIYENGQRHGVSSHSRSRETQKFVRYKKWKLGRQVYSCWETIALVHYAPSQNTCRDLEP